MRYVDELTGALKSQLALAYSTKDLLGYGLRRRLRDGYSLADFRADARASVVVGLTALPIALALAIAVEVPPQYGLYTAIIAGILGALLGGTRTQIAGPTAALIVVSLPVVHKFGVAGLLVAGGLAGAILIVMGLARMGRLFQLVPHPVTTGFTAGVAAVIWVTQLPSLLGVAMPHQDSPLAVVRGVAVRLGEINGWTAATAGATLALLVGIPRVTRRVPATLVALTVVSAAVALLQHGVPDAAVATIGSVFTSSVDGQVLRGVPPVPPLPMLPWTSGTGAEFSYAMFRELVPSAFAIAALAAIESLTSATVSDGMTGSKHDPNAELIGLGIANLVCPFFGGIAASGALARTTANLRAGARSPLAGVLQGALVLACTIVLAPLMSYLPLSALAATLVIIALNLSEVRHFARLLHIGQRSDVLVMITCFTLTVGFDMVLAVAVGVGLAALLFMRRMAVLTQVALDTRSSERFALPPGVHLYEVAGPLFFGAAKSAMDVLYASGRTSGTLILSMVNVPIIDATGLVAVESTLDRLLRSETLVILAGLQPEVADVFDRAGIKRIPGKLAIAPDVETAINMAMGQRRSTAS
ncbi:MAG: SulP family inorganic anion transporter [Kofleriaceae bacterium]